MKIEILAVPTPLNNSQLIMKVDLLGQKSSNYALKLWNGKNKFVMKNANISGRSNCTFMKIKILVVSDPLNNSQLIMKVDLLGPKSSKVDTRCKQYFFIF